MFRLVPDWPEWPDLLDWSDCPLPEPLIRRLDASFAELSPRDPDSLLLRPLLPASRFLELSFEDSSFMSPSLLPELRPLELSELLREPSL